MRKEVSRSLQVALGMKSRERMMAGDMITTIFS